MKRRPILLLRRNLSSVNDALIDSFSRRHTYLRMSLTERCNFRCTYCMPLDGVDLTDADKLMSFEEQKRTLSIFSSLGMTKLRFTGGEPTLNKKLPELIRHARQNSAIQSIGITTNGKQNQQDTASLEISNETNRIRIVIPRSFAACITESNRAELFFDWRQQLASNLSVCFTSWLHCTSLTLLNSVRIDS